MKNTIFTILWLLLAVPAFAQFTGGIGDGFDKYAKQTPFFTLPVLSTEVITNINLNSASSGGNITSDGGASVTARGVVVGSTSGPTVASNIVKTENGNGLGSFTSSIIGLTEYTVYYVRAYATNSAGTAYGNQVAFATIPTLGEWGLIALGSLFALGGGWFVWRRMIA